MTLISITAESAGDWIQREFVVLAENIQIMRSYHDAYIKKDVYQICIGVDYWLSVTKEQYELVQQQLRQA